MIKHLNKQNNRSPLNKFAVNGHPTTLMESEKSTKYWSHTSQDNTSQNSIKDSQSLFPIQDDASTFQANFVLIEDPLHSLPEGNEDGGEHHNIPKVKTVMATFLEGDSSAKTKDRNVMTCVDESPHSQSESKFCQCTFEVDILNQNPPRRLSNEKLNCTGEHFSSHKNYVSLASNIPSLLPSTNLFAQELSTKHGPHHQHYATCQEQSTCADKDQNSCVSNESNFQRIDPGEQATADDIPQRQDKREIRPCCYPWRFKRKWRVHQFMIIFFIYIFAIGSVQFQRVNHIEDSLTDTTRKKRDVALSSEEGTLSTGEETLSTGEEEKDFETDAHDLFMLGKKPREQPYLNKSRSEIAEVANVSSEKNQTDKDDCEAAAGHNLPDDFLPTQFAHNGGWLIHLAIGFYMFAAVAGVCDIYFVPALEHICEDLGLQADVAGATFMAAASSAPEFCTSVIGVFLAKNDVGLGAIVGSSIFNLLVIIGLCSIFANMPVQLAWYPLTRDSIFYSISVFEMALFMADTSIKWWEALIMVCTYLFYILAMLVNSRLEPWANDFVNDKCEKTTKVVESEAQMRNRLRRSSSMRLRMISQRRYSRLYPNGPQSQLHLTKSAMRELNRMGISDDEAFSHIKVMEEIEDRKKKEMEVEKRMGRLSLDGRVPAAIVKLINSSGVDIEKPEASNRESAASVKDSEPSEEEVNQLDDRGSPVPEVRSSDQISVQLDEITNSPKRESLFIATLAAPSPSVSVSTLPAESDNLQNSRIEISQYENPLEMPEGFLGKCYFMLVFPVTLLHACTIPDSRILDTWQARCYMLSFGMSVVYISLYSYIMVWMISLAGIVWGIPETVTGLTLLAAGTSVPDCLASIFVARDGYGDMAVSNAIGSNVFDILLCLGVPWLIDAIINNSHGYSINSQGMVYAVLTLGLTICYLWFSMKLVRWTLTPAYGWFTLCLYLVIIIICILVELNVFFVINPCL